VVCGVLLRGQKTPALSAPLLLRIGRIGKKERKKGKIGKKGKARRRGWRCVVSTGRDESRPGTMNRAPHRPFGKYLGCFVGMTVGEHEFFGLGGTSGGVGTFDEDEIRIPPQGAAGRNLGAMDRFVCPARFGV